MDIWKLTPLYFNFITVYCLPSAFSRVIKEFEDDFGHGDADHFGQFGFFGHGDGLQGREPLQQQSGLFLAQAWDGDQGLDQGFVDGLGRVTLGNKR